MAHLRRSIIPFVALLVLSAVPAAAQLLRFHGSGVFVGSQGIPPETVAESGGASYEFVAVQGLPPISSTATSRTYLALYAWVQLAGSNQYHLLLRPTITVTIDRENENFGYFLHGRTLSGWRFSHSAYSTHPSFVPADLSLPATTPEWPPGDSYAAGFVDLWGPNYIWHVYSDSGPWFEVQAIP